VSSVPTAHSMPITERPSTDKKVSAERSRPPNLDFYARLYNKEITIKTITGAQITGTLRAFGLVAKLADQGITFHHEEEEA